MIFKKDLARKILHGEKTMTRRPVKPGETGCRYRVGTSYAVQYQRGDRGRFRIVITGVRAERLGQITEEDAKAEGFKGSDDFLAYWNGLYGTMTPDLEQPVWVITFAPDREHVPRLMHQRSELGYTANGHQAMRGELEAVSHDDLERFASEGWKRHEHLHKTRRQPLREADTEIALQERLLGDHRGKSPERVVEDDPQQGRPQDVRLRRRSMGLDERTGYQRVA